MRLINVAPPSLVGKMIIFRHQYWQVNAVEAGNIRLSRYHMGSGTRGRLRIQQLAECRLFPTFDVVAKSYPRLVRKLRRACILSQSEAENCIQGYLTTGMSYVGPEAVAHVGGAQAAIRHAIRCRHAFGR